jgi:hypothetical protein
VDRRRPISGRKGEGGVVILLVAIALLFVVGAMAVLAIDVVTFYTARSQAQLAADGAALAGARVMANSGSTSNPALLEPLAQALAITTAKQVAAQNKVGGRYLNPATEVTVTPSSGASGYNPRVTVQVTRNDLPTFFARIWGRTQVAVSAMATAEAYNPSGANISLIAGGRIAPVCAKPWLLPNLDPIGKVSPIFDTSGTIVNNDLVGQSWQLEDNCDSCGVLPGPTAGKYYPGAIDPGATDPQEFPVPTQALPACSAAFSSNLYQLAVAGCVQQPIACGANANFKIDINPYTPTGTDRNTDTLQSASCLIHDKGADGDSDRIDSISAPPLIQFVGGNANPIAGAVDHNILVSDSLVTVPVFDSPNPTVTSPVQVVGFLQVFLNPQGTALTGTQIKTTIINMAGCGKTSTAQPILGNGASAIPVRLISNP